MNERQRVAAGVLAATGAPAAAAAAAGVSERTIRRWREQAAFTAHVASLADDNARETARVATRRAVSVMLELLEHSDPRIRLQAARVVLAHAATQAALTWAEPPNAIRVVYEGGDEGENTNE
jgi:hypothetical protein